MSIEAVEVTGGRIVSLKQQIDLIENKRVLTSSDLARLRELRSDLRKAQREMNKLKSNIPVLPGF